jgi:hypothetical protein
MQNTSHCHCNDKDDQPLGTAAGQFSNAKKPYKKFGGNKQMAFMQTISRLMQKTRKLVCPWNAGSLSMTLVTAPTVNWKLGERT